MLHAQTIQLDPIHGICWLEDLSIEIHQLPQVPWYFSQDPHLFCRGNKREVLLFRLAQLLDMILR